LVLATALPGAFDALGPRHLDGADGGELDLDVGEHGAAAARQVGDCEMEIAIARLEMVRDHDEVDIAVVGVGQASVPWCG
jgi:hypothetical protein